ncbi:hypothetical protein APHAL10511_003901 [Amanita phalloides]|nr:hypothetical protein APHAL10511_003901 [Amanita phalloides]
MSISLYLIIPNNRRNETKKATRSEEILQKKNISVAPPARKHSNHYLPFSAPLADSPATLATPHQVEEGETDDSDSDTNGHTTDEYVPADSEKVDKENPLVDIEEVDISNDQEESGQIVSALDNMGFDRTGVIGASGDIDMASPPPEGSSRVTGGILRGRAIGNVLNLPDADDMVEPAIPAKGTVKLFSDLALKPSQHKPAFTFSTRAESSLGPVLERLGRFYSPVRHNNYQIFVHEGGSWNLKGRFSHAVEEDEDILWVTDNGQLTLAVCAEGKDILAAPVGQPVHTVPLSKAATKQGDLSKNELIVILKVPEHLTQTQKNPGHP